MALPFDPKQSFKDNIANLHEHFTEKAKGCKGDGDACEAAAKAEPRESYKQLHMKEAVGHREKEKAFSDRAAAAKGGHSLVDPADADDRLSNGPLHAAAAKAGRLRFVDHT
jgi:hypothetical protein